MASATIVKEAVEIVPMCSLRCGEYGFIEDGANAGKIVIMNYHGVATLLYNGDIYNDGNQTKVRKLPKGTKIEVVI